ncbi:MAG: hypothetical protein M3Y51_06690 [Actinomycetota bacterium]|nr:hypothetical protein [Actinomycetota bacterium]
MSERRWFNPNVPQTLYIAQFLLYFDAFWMLLGVFTGVGLGVLGLLALAAYVYGAYGIANEKKLGYQIAVVASFIPLAIRLVIFLTGRESFTFVLFSSSILNVLFEYALIALLLHPMSREHQKIWFR